MPRIKQAFICNGHQHLLYWRFQQIQQSVVEVFTNVTVIFVAAGRRLQAKHLIQLLALAALRFAGV